MEFNKYFDLLEKNKLINKSWKYVFEIIAPLLSDVENKDEVMKLISIYFSLIDDGNIAIPLDAVKLNKLWNSKLNSNGILLMSTNKFSDEEYQEITNNSLKAINFVTQDFIDNKFNTIVGDNKIFKIDKEHLYVHKYFIARHGIASSIKRLFTKNNESKQFDYKDIVGDDFSLKAKQEEVALKGVNQNLIVTGGPGTGKTTSIFFIIYGILKYNMEYEVHITAPSGKAAERIQESLNNIRVDKTKVDKNVLEKIQNIQGKTIHRLLNIDSNGMFRYNKEHQFVEKSIFVIDEASMIDACLFNSLLEAIPTGARVFILGDKNQLPSVDCGAVFGELLNSKYLKDSNFIIELDESVRFKETTDIYQLARVINSNGDLSSLNIKWNSIDDFIIETTNKERCPVFYYEVPHLDSYKLLQDKISNISSIWGNKFYSSLQDECMDINENDIDFIKRLIKKINTAKILCAENEGPLGVKEINKTINKLVIDFNKCSTIINYYPGQIMMINKNNKSLDLYNGDTGVLVTFKDDPTLYFMVNKKCTLVKDSGKKNNQVFKLTDDYAFYPLRLISPDEIDLAFAISIHKSQGSDYENILVVLPNKIGHPLLNRQIVYTAITRTKGNTYVLSNNTSLNEAKENLILRITPINDILDS